MIAKFSFILFAAIFGVVFANEKLHEIADRCITKLKLDEDSFREWFPKRPVETDDPKFKCYFKCALQELKWMDDDGNILENPGIDLEDAEIISYGKQCRNDVQGSDDCEKAFNFHKCVMEKKEGN